MQYTESLTNEPTDHTGSVNVALNQSSQSVIVNVSLLSLLGPYSC